MTPFSQHNYACENLHNINRPGSCTPTLAAHVRLGRGVRNAATPFPITLLGDPVDESGQTNEVVRGQRFWPARKVPPGFPGEVVQPIAGESQRLVIAQNFLYLLSPPSEGGPSEHSE